MVITLEPARAKRGRISGHAVSEGWVLVIGTSVLQASQQGSGRSSEYAGALCLDARFHIFVALLLVGCQRARFVFEHDRNTVANRKREPLALANKFLRPLVINERALANRADENFEQFRVHGFTLQPPAARSPDRANAARDKGNQL